MTSVVDTHGSPPRVLRHPLLASVDGPMGVRGVAGFRSGSVGGFEVFAVYSAAIRVREWPQLLAFRNFHGEGRLRYYSSSVTAG